MKDMDRTKEQLIDELEGLREKVAGLEAQKARSDLLGEALRESEARLQSILDYASAAIYLKDTSGRYIFANRECEASLGLDRGGLIGKTDYDLFSKEVADEFLANDREIIESGSPIEFEDNLSFNGESYTYLARKFPLFDSEGKVYAVCGISTDITERKRAEEVLLFQKEILSKIASGVAAVRTEDSTIVYTNPSFDELFGYGSGELLGENVTILNAPTVERSPEEVAGEIIETLSKHGVWRGEIRNIRNDGTPFWCQASVSEYQSPEHGTVWLGVHEDITERKQAEEALRENEEKLRVFLNATHDGVVMQDRDGTVLVVNESSAAKFGRTPEEMTGECVWDIFPQEVIPARMANVDKVFKTGEPVRMEDERQGIWLDTMIYPVFDSEGEISSVAVFSRDITEHKHMEEELRTHRDQLEEVVRERTAELVKFNEELMREIAERIRTERAIRESEERYRAIFEGASEGILLVDTETRRYKHANPRIAGMLGYSTEEFLGMKVDDIHPKGAEIAMENFQRAVRGEIDRAEEIPCLKKDGSVVYMDIGCARLKVGGRDSLLGFFTDVTERKHMEMALRESEEKYRRFFKTSRDCAFITSKEGLIVDVSDSTPEFFGYRSNEEIGEFRVQDFYENPDDRPAHIRKIAQDGFTKDYPVNLRRMDGSVINTLITSVPVKDEDGNVVGFQGTIRDITERKKAEKALRESEERFRQVAENAGEWIWEVDADGLYTYSSPVVETILGYKPEEIVNKKHFYDLSHPEDREELKQVAFEVFARKDNFLKFGNRNIHKNGEEVWLSTSGVPLLDEKGDLLGYRGTDMDITESKQAAEAIQEQLRFLQTLMDTIPAPIYYTDTQGVYRGCNSAFENFMGHTRKEIIGSTVHDIAPREMADVSGRADEMLLKRPGTQIYDGPVQYSDGSPRDVIFVKATYTDAQDKVSGIVGVMLDITDRKHAEVALGESEQKYRLLVENIPAVVYRGYTDWTVDFIDDKIEELTGHSADEFNSRRMKWSELIEQEDLPRLREEFIRALKSERSYVREYRIRTRDGDAIWIQDRGHILCSEDGEIDYVDGVFFDITDRKLAGIRLEREFGAINSVINDMLGGEVDDAQNEERVLDACLAATDSVYGMIGVINEHGLWDTTTYNSRTLTDCAFPEALAWELSKGMTIRGTWGWPMLHGEPLICNDLQAHPDRVGLPEGHVPIRCFLGVPLRYEGETVGMVAVANKPGGYTSEDQDALIRLASVISVSREHRQALIVAKMTSAELERLVEERTAELKKEIEDRKLAEELSRIVLQTALDSFWLCDTMGNILEVNDAACKMTGYSRDELLKMSVPDIEALETPQEIVQHIQRVVEAGGDFFETRHRRKDGGLIDVEISTTYLDTEGGRFFGFIRDITERKRADEALKQSEERLRILSSHLLDAQEKERARISRELHDVLGQSVAFLRVRLESIAGKLGKHDLTVEDEYRKNLEYIDEIINNVRRISRDLSPSVLEDFGLIVAINGLADRFSELYHFDVSLHATDVTRLLTKESQINLYRIFQEALSNIAKHSGASHVSVDIVQEGDFVSLQIEDNGMGFDVKHALKKDYDEMGMGLTTMEERARILGAEFVIDSQRGEGTRIGLRVPTKVGE